MANSIAAVKNYTTILDEDYQRAAVSRCLSSLRRMVRASCCVPIGCLRRRWAAGPEGDERTPPIVVLQRGPTVLALLRERPVHALDLPVLPGL